LTLLKNSIYTDELSYHFVVVVLTLFTLTQAVI